MPYITPAITRLLLFIFLSGTVPERVLLAEHHAPFATITLHRAKERGLINYYHNLITGERIAYLTLTGEHYAKEAALQRA